MCCSTTNINDENVNLSSWFDNPPASFLALWENVVSGADSSLSCLFPDRSSLIFNCYADESTLGDVNGDGYLNLFDVVRIINVIVGNASFTPEQMILADIDQNSYLDILDVVKLVNFIINQS